MCKHELKICPCCHHSFECKVSNIAHCHCADVCLSPQLSAFIKEKYSDCLCNECLLKYKNEYGLLKQ